MILLSDRLPLIALSRWGSLEERPWGIPLPIAATEGDFDSPRRPARFYPWLLNTAYTGKAYIWQSDLAVLGLNPHRQMRQQRAVTLSAFGQSVVNRERTAALWLFSNIPSLV